MSALIPFLTLDQTCEQVKELVDEELTNSGFRIVQTFDLHVARLAHPDCTCPNHGTDDCNCQMVVLLVYKKKSDPATLVIHGQEGKSWLSLAAPEGSHNQRFETTIQGKLRSGLSNLLSRAEVTYESAQSAI